MHSKTISKNCILTWSALLGRDCHRTISGTGRKSLISANLCVMDGPLTPEYKIRVGLVEVLGSRIERSYVIFAEGNPLEAGLGWLT